MPLNLERMNVKIANVLGFARLFGLRWACEPASSSNGS
jgi:hypothetical protein